MEVVLLLEARAILEQYSAILTRDLITNFHDILVEVIDAVLATSTPTLGFLRGKYSDFRRKYSFLDPRGRGSSQPGGIVMSGDYDELEGLILEYELGVKVAEDDFIEEEWKNRSCIGCCDKSRPITAVEEPSKGLRIQGQLVRKQSISDDFWSTSTCDLFENSALQSQRSFSSISISNQSLSGSCSSSNPPEFVNHGLLLWNQSRLQWVGTNKSRTHKKIQEPILSWNASYENLLGTSKRFPQPVPLSEMVDFLVDIWDQEGLCD